MHLHASCYHFYHSRCFTSPEVPDRIVRHEVQVFMDNIDRSLAVGPSTCNTLYFKFSHDVYRMLFGIKNSLSASDFCSRYFSLGWDCNYKKGVELFMVVR